jgi:uncharacterized membrane protein
MFRTKFFFSAIVVAYPIIVYFGVQYFDTRLIALTLIFLALGRLLLVKGLGLPHSNLIAAALLLVGISTVAANSPVLLQYYPVCLSALLFAVFLTSLFRPPSIVEQIARLKAPNLPEAGVSYTRKVTMIWCGFFAFNGSMALYTILNTNIDLWAIYNGLISYILMGLLFALEYLVRRRLYRKTTRHQGEQSWL